MICLDSYSNGFDPTTTSICRITLFPSPPACPCIRCFPELYSLYSFRCSMEAYNEALSQDTHSHRKRLVGDRFLGLQTQLRSTWYLYLKPPLPPPKQAMPTIVVDEQGHYLSYEDTGAPNVKSDKSYTTFLIIHGTSFHSG